MYMPSGYKSNDFDTPEKIKRLNDLNAEIQDTLFCEGEFYIHTFSIPDLAGIMGTGQEMLQPMRYMCGNPVTKPDDIDAMVEAVRVIGKRLEKDFFDPAPTIQTPYNDGLQLND